MPNKLYVTITSKPLYKAIEEKLPAVETTVELGETCGMELLRIVREAQKHIGGQRENH